MVLGKNWERFWFQWLEMGICLQVNSLSCSKVLGRLGVTLRIYLMSYLSSTFRLVEFLAQSRQRQGRIWTGKVGWLDGIGLSFDSVVLLGNFRFDLSFEQLELMRRFFRFSIEVGGELFGEYELFILVSQCFEYFVWNLLKLFVVRVRQGLGERLLMLLV